MKKLIVIQIFLLIIFTISCCRKEIFLPNKKTETLEGSGSASPKKDGKKITHKDSMVKPIDDTEVELESSAPAPNIESSNPKPIQTESTKPTIRIVKVQNSRVYDKTQHEGKIVYKIPTEMKVRETYQVIVRIGKSSINIYENLDGQVRESVIPVTQTMEVNLIDPSPKDSKAFDIIADNNAVQIVDSTETYTQWSWNVTPLKAGKTELKVVVSIIRDGNKKEEVYSDKVEVKINPIKQILFWLKNYWQWLLTTLLIPVFKWIYDNYIKKKKEE